MSAYELRLAGHSTLLGVGAISLDQLLSVF